MHPDLVVGKRFPDLTLPDHRHQPITLSELAKVSADRELLPRLLVTEMRAPGAALP
jgi:hypothetical protein